MLWILLLAPVLTRGPVVVGVTSDTAYIAWDTSAHQANGTVKFGSSYGVYPGSAQDTDYTENHHVTLSGLLPGTTYHYAIDSDPAAQDSAFTTAPESGSAPIRFIVYGDNRTNTAEHQNVVDAIRREAGISFLLHTGDMAQNYPFSQEWDTFFQVEHELLRNTPLFPTVGNHETLDTLYHWGLFFSPPRFDPSNTVRYYSANWAQLHLVVLDTFDKTGPAVDSNLDTISAAQLEWMKADLDAARGRGKLIFASLHHGHASHATGPDAHRGSALVGAQVIPELVGRGAMAVFAGHDHIYERGCNSGIDYFVAGGGGAPLYPVDLDGGPSGAIVAKSTLAYSVITVRGADVSGVTKDPAGNVIDQFTLPSPGCEKPDAGPGNPGPDAGVPDAGTSPPAPAQGHSCGSAGAATLLSLLPLLFRRRLRASS